MSVPPRQGEPAGVLEVSGIVLDTTAVGALARGELFAESIVGATIGRAGAVYVSVAAAAAAVVAAPRAPTNVVDLLSRISSILLVDLTRSELRAAEAVATAVNSGLPEPGVPTLHTLLVAAARDMPVLTARPGWYPGLRTIAL